MKRLALALVLAAFVLPAAARAGTVYGVTEDAGKYSTDGGAAFFAKLRDVGMSENAVSVQWDPDHPTTIFEKPLLDRMVPAAAHAGVRIVFAVYFTRSMAVTGTPDGPARFAAFLRLLARTYPQVQDFVVGNEPNYGVFWQPQFGYDGKPAAGAAYENLLARSYDALKSVDPRIDVIGMGLAARGNDRPESRSPSTSPVSFVRDVGAAYRASGRTRPLMDALAYHPYPASSLSSLATTQGWPNAGVADLSRLKQAVWDAFHDTTQATFENGLALKITEIGWQVAVPPSSLGAYHGSENVRTTDEQTQARIYADLVRQLACDPAVTDVLFFHLMDETSLSGFQSGLVRADGSLRPSYAAVKAAITATGGHCTGVETTWQHTETVAGASVGFLRSAKTGEPGFVATAEEGATYRAALVRVDGAPTASERDSLERSLEADALAAAAAGPVPAYGRAEPTLVAPVAPGKYVVTVLVSAAANPARTDFFVSEPFAVAEPSSGTAAPPATQSSSQPPASPPSTPSAPSAPASPATSALPGTPVSPASSFVVTPSPSGAAKPRSATFSRVTRKRTVAPVPGSANFQKLPAPHPKPSRSDLSVANAPAPRRGAATAVPSVTANSKLRGSLAPIFVAFLLAGAALSAVLTVRALRS